MGTNYYWHEKPKCPHCGQDQGETLHIGKSSGGWCFSLHVEQSEGLMSLEDWQERFARPGSWIGDEYGDTLTAAEMLSEITERSWPRPVDKPAEWYRSNHAEQGPEGLARHAIGPYCVGHGAGTWDLIPGEFS